MMTLERAVEINRVMVHMSLYTLGVKDTCPEPIPCSLEEMIEATRMIQKENAADSHRKSMVCDDRLLAAIYAFWHFPGDSEEIRPIVRDSKKALVCVLAPPETEENSSDE